jgi:hypothetical protein
MKKVFTVTMIVISIVIALALYSILNQQKSKKTPELNEIFRRMGDLIVQKYSHKFVLVPVRRADLMNQKFSIVLLLKVTYISIPIKLG